MSFLFILAKLIGNRAISQMNLFDYINSITIGSIAAELSTAEPHEIPDLLIAMLIYATAVITFAVISCKSLAFRRFVEGRSIILMKNGKIYNKNFKKAKIDINEFLMQCRLKGYYNLDDIQVAIQESNGKVSVLPTAAARNVTPQDLALYPDESMLYANVILDGQVLLGNLKQLGFCQEWLEKQLKQQKAPKLCDIFLAACNQSGELTIYQKQPRQDEKDTFDL